MPRIMRVTVLAAMVFMGTVVWQTSCCPASAASLGSDDGPMPAEMQTPIMRQASVAFRKGDAKTGVAFIRQAVRSGNSVAEVALGKLYAEGRGVPKDYVQAINILGAVVKRQKQPSLGLATAALEDIATSLKNSPIAGDRQLAALAMALPLATNPYVRRVGRAIEYSVEHSHVEICHDFFCY